MNNAQLLFISLLFISSRADDYETEVLKEDASTRLAPSFASQPAASSNFEWLRGLATAAAVTTTPSLPVVEDKRWEDDVVAERPSPIASAPSVSTPGDDRRFLAIARDNWSGREGTQQSGFVNRDGFTGTGSSGGFSGGRANGLRTPNHHLWNEGSNAPPPQDTRSILSSECNLISWIINGCRGNGNQCSTLTTALGLCSGSAAPSAGLFGGLGGAGASNNGAFGSSTIQNSQNHGGSSFGSISDGSSSRTTAMLSRPRAYYDDCNILQQLIGVCVKPDLSSDPQEFFRQRGLRQPCANLGVVDFLGRRPLVECLCPGFGISLQIGICRPRTRRMLWRNI